LPLCRAGKWQNPGRREWSDRSYSFNTKQLFAGIYFIRIEEGEKVTKLKFIKEQEK